MREETILFVCLHGAAKSLVAASHFQRLAGERGVKARAEFAGTEPDPALTPAAVAGLLAEGIDVRGQRPRRVTGDDIRRASRVVSFGCDLGALAPGIPVERWDDVPAVSENYQAARDAIVSRLPALLESAPGRLPTTSTRASGSIPERR
jgi:arsenate reductase